MSSQQFASVRTIAGETGSRWRWPRSGPVPEMCRLSSNGDTTGNSRESAGTARWAPAARARRLRADAPRTGRRQQRLHRPRRGRPAHRARPGPPVSTARRTADDRRLTRCHRAARQGWSMRLLTRSPRIGCGWRLRWGRRPSQRASCWARMARRCLAASSCATDSLGRLGMPRCRPAPDVLTMVFWISACPAA